MSWLRDLSYRLFGRYHYLMTQDTAIKLTHASRIVYFLSATGLGFMVWEMLEVSQQEAAAKESNLPILEDIDNAHKILRESGIETAIVTTYVPGEGFVSKPYDRQRYLKDLETKAFLKSKLESHKEVDDKF